MKKNKNSMKIEITKDRHIPMKSLFPIGIKLGCCHLCNNMSSICDNLCNEVINEKFKFLLI